MPDPLPADPTPPAEPTKLTKPEVGLMALLAAINCAEITDALLMTPLAKKLQDDLALTVEQYTYASAVYGFAAAVCGLLSSAVVDRFDRKRVILFALAGLVASIAATGCATAFGPLLAARLLAGAFGGLTTCSTLAVIGDLIPERRRGAALGLLGSSFAFAAVLGLPACVAAGLLSGSIWPSFATVAAAGAAVWVWALLRLPSVTGHRRTVRKNPLAEFAAVVSRRNHAVAFAMVLCVGLGTYCVIPLMAMYMELNCGVPPAHIAVIFLAMGACSLGSAVLAGKLTDRLGRRPVFAGAILLTVAVTLLVTNLPPVSSLVAGAVASAYMAVAVARLVPTHAIMLRAADPRFRGGYTTAYNSVSLLGTSVGPLIAGRIVSNPAGQLADYPVCGLVACGFSLAGLGLSFLVKPGAPAADEPPAAAP